MSNGISDLPLVQAALQALAPGCKIEPKVATHNWKCAGTIEHERGMFGIDYGPDNEPSPEQIAAERERAAADARADLEKGDRP